MQRVPGSKDILGAISKRTPKGKTAPENVGPSSAQPFVHEILVDEPVTSSPVKCSVVFKYPEIEKVLLSMALDLAVGGSSQSYLDPAKPLVINGQMVKVPDLPADPAKLRVIQLAGVDITSFIASNSSGAENAFEVSYISGRGGLPWKRQGKISLSVTVTTPAKKTARYCFFCGSENEPGAKQCVRCQKLLEVGGEQTVACAKCGETIPLRPDVRFCDKCGALQEAMAKEEAEKKKCTNCGALIDADAVFCSKCGASQSA